MAADKCCNTCVHCNIHTCPNPVHPYPNDLFVCNEYFSLVKANQFYLYPPKIMSNKEKEAAMVISNLVANNPELAENIRNTQNSQQMTGIIGFMIIAFLTYVNWDQIVEYFWFLRLN